MVLCSLITPHKDRLEWRHDSGGAAVLTLPLCFWNTAWQFTSIYIHTTGANDVIVRGSDLSGDPLLALSSNLVEISLHGVLLQDPVTGNGIAGDGSFTANISAVLEKYPHLETLSINSGGIRGSIPIDLSSYTALRVVSLGYNQLTGPLPLLYPPSMLTFVAPQNNLTGALPNSLPSTTMNYDISHNKVSGNIPASFLAGLNASPLNIRLSFNSLTGGIPGTLFSPFRPNGYLLLDLASNKLSSTIPSILFNGFNYETFMLYLDNNEIHGGLPNFDVNFNARTFLLSLENNLLGGTISSSWAAGHSHSALSFLTLNFAGNQFSNAVPNFFTSLSQATSTLQMADFNFQSNAFSGTIPPSLMSPTSQFTNLRILNWNMKGNALTGSISSTLLTRLHHLEELRMDLSDNAFIGWLPTFQGMSPTDKLVLDLSGNNFVGTIPASFWTVFDQTAHISVNISLARNNLVGEIPTIPFDMMINLDNNKLTSYSVANTLASDRAASTQSTIISIRNNKLEGVLNFPASSTPTKLQLYVNNNSLSELVVNGDISNYLTALDVSDNVDLVGTIPSSFLSNMSSVEVLRARNTSMSGEFPNISYELTSQLRELVLSNSGIDFCNGSRIGWLKSDLTVCDLNNTTAVRCAQAYPSQCSIGGSAPPIYGPHGSPARPSSPTTSGPEPIRVPTGASSQVMTSIYTSVIALMSYFILL